MRRLPWLPAAIVSSGKLLIYGGNSGKFLANARPSSRFSQSHRILPNRKMATATSPLGNLESTTSTNPSYRENILAKSWTIVARGYEESFVPRFAAWTHDALAALNKALEIGADDSRGSPPKALVLCCGPGQELLPIAKILGPAAQVLGVDLAPGMIELAERRIEQECAHKTNTDILLSNISLQVGDAMKPPLGPYRAIFSAFGLQQLPKPIEAVKEWIEVLEKPGGVGVIIYWPPDAPEDGGPFEVWDNLLKTKLGKEESLNASPPWDEGIVAALTEAGGDVILDEYITHPISFDNAQDLFEKMPKAGPWHAMRLRRGDDFVNKMGRELQAAYPADDKPLAQKFTARMLVVRGRDQKFKP